VDLYLSGLQIHEHADKQSQECSGGTKRKLSFAMAMVGGPKVILMDEPSTGMDPRSKRFLWDTILASFQVILPYIVHYKLKLFSSNLSQYIFQIIYFLKDYKNTHTHTRAY